MKSVVHSQKARLFRLAYRMLGTVADAEDVVQEAMLRLHNQNIATIETPAAWLTTTVTRLCLDQLRESRKKRDAYVGAWLPEPLEEQAMHQHSEMDDPIELSQSLTLAFMQLLDRLNPVERAVYLLRQAFEMDYSDIATTVSKSEDNCRQLFHRARRQLGNVEAEPLPNDDEANRWLQLFLATCQSGDFAQLKSALAEDVVVYADSGGRARSLLRPISGTERVAHFLMRVAQADMAGVSIQVSRVNGEPALIFSRDNEVFTVMVFSFRRQKLWRLYSMRNPEKLRHINMAALR